MSHSPSRGVVYGVSGLPYAEETLRSARSVRRWMPELSLALHIDAATLDGVAGPEAGLFDRVVRHDTFAHHRSAKFTALLASPFEETLYLDGDTLLAGRIDELFELLGRFELAASHAPQRLHPRSLAVDLYDLFPPIPAAFPELNTGVLPFRRGEVVTQLFERWLRYFERSVAEKGYRMDQPAFRAALYESDVRFYTLTQEYNFRANAAMVLNGPVKIVHAHGPLERIASNVNRHHGPRIYTPGRNPAEPRPDEIPLDPATPKGV